ncbi:ABC transporter ATP-binding protein [Mycolicibacterium brumae]|uniref:ABC-type quaternary amine transporter n=1 Tax=Mycolicibacterium brumae TaxID=85968 RepID=A0A2G5PDS2_9MYCO|nr:ABC transporter ATP-binding protein [Mycolicibacterium brumae]MCV7192850.1 ABC transporter ATP-binding protein [Mycolicibacterium brumae]PIB76482.1 ABC transporter ATP-binding protein [Mycolicibacterium brumae]RWA23440.1 hypothetical protein MBRU_01060 [Mycolicibacterium brumae DSM 44177]UWW08630.1 ABC transporter ATP-binding protein [Mycolicibacterium brumae]
MSEPGVDIAGLAKAFGARQVLRGIDLAVPNGTLTAVLGPSGCGKTTLLRIVAGFCDPDAGAVRIAGRMVAEPGRGVPAHRRRVGLMPQEGALFPQLSVAGNVEYGIPAARRSPAELGRWLGLVGLDGLAGARPHELSGGQQQRVALARALAARPQVLLLDEPFAALDAGLRVRVREDIANILRASGTTSVLVTHDQSEALSLAESVAVLLDGRLAQHSAPDELYRLPADLEVARFVGDAMELAGRRDGSVARTALGAHPVRNAGADGPATVVLRPEQLVRGDGDDPQATVTARRFYGSATALQVVLDDGAALTLAGPAQRAAEPGERIGIRVEGSVLAY